MDIVIDLISAKKALKLPCERHENKLLFALPSNIKKLTWLQNPSNVVVSDKVSSKMNE